MRIIISKLKYYHENKKPNALRQQGNSNQVVFKLQYSFSEKVQELPGFMVSLQMIAND